MSESTDEANVTETELAPECSEAAEADSNNSISLDVNSEKNENKQKVDILLKPTGNAPIMKRKKWTIDADKEIGWIMEFMKRYLKLEPDEKLFLYVNQTFAPSPDQTVRNLYNSYSTEGKLVLHYCKSQAWG